MSKDLNTYVVSLPNSIRKVNQVDLKNEQYDFRIEWRHTQTRKTNYDHTYEFNLIEFLDKENKPYILKNSHFRCDDHEFKEDYYNYQFPLSDNKRILPGYKTGYNITIKDSLKESRVISIQTQYEGTLGLKVLLDLFDQIEKYEIKTWKEYDLFKKVEFQETKLKRINDEMTELQSFLDQNIIDLNILKDNFRIIDKTIKAKFEDRYLNNFQIDYIWTKRKERALLKGRNVYTKIAKS